jgi:hypothetical protein
MSGPDDNRASQSPQPEPSLSAALAAAGIGLAMPLVAASGLLLGPTSDRPRVWLGVGAFACFLGTGLGVQSLVWACRAPAAGRGRKGLAVALAVLALLLNAGPPLLLWALVKTLEGIGR